MWGGFFIIAKYVYCIYGIFDSILSISLYEDIFLSSFVFTINFMFLAF